MSIPEIIWFSVDVASFVIWVSLFVSFVKEYRAWKVRRKSVRAFLDSDLEKASAEEKKELCHNFLETVVVDHAQAQMRCWMLILASATISAIILIEVCSSVLLMIRP